MGGDADTFLKNAGAGYPAVKFAEVGDTVRGKILDDPKVISRPNLNDGKPEDNLVINLDTTGNEDGYRTLWVRFGALATAIKEAVREAGASGIAEGGELAVKFTELRDTGKPQPAKIYKAKYEPPVSSGVDVDEIF